MSHKTMAKSGGRSTGAVRSHDAGSPSAPVASKSRPWRLGCMVVSLAAFAVAISTPSLSPAPASLASFSGLQPAEAAGLVASMKRAANQGWRTGARWLCTVFGLQYEHVKSVFRRSGRHLELETLSEEVDRYLQLVEAAGHNEGNLPDAYQERGVHLVLAAQELFSRVLGKRVELPARYKAAARRFEAMKKKKKDSGSRKGPAPESATEAPAPAEPTGSDASSSGAEARPQAESPAKEASKPEAEAVPAAASSLVAVPMRDRAFEESANERLRALKARHEADVSAIVDEANTRLKQYQEEHKMTYDKKISHLRAQQHAELDQALRELQEETLRFEDGKKQYEVVSALLTEAKAGIAVLSEGLQFIGANFYSIDQQIDKVAEEQKELEQADGDKAMIQKAFLVLQHAGLAQEQGAQAAIAIRTRSAEIADVVAQLEELLSRADTALSTAPVGSLFESQQQGYSEYLRSYQVNVAESKEKVTSFEQEADAKLLALTYRLEQLQAKAVGNLGAVTEKLAAEYSMIQNKAQELEQGYQDFFDACAHVEEQTFNTAKSAVEDRATFADLYSSLQAEFNNLQVTLERQGENVKQLNADVSNVEKIAAVFMEGLNSAPLSREALAQLNAQPVAEMTRFFSGYKQQVSVASTALHQRYQTTQDLRRKLDLLHREIRVLADPATLERLEAEVMSLVADLEAKQRDQVEADAETKQARAVVQTLQKDLRQLEQRLMTERRLAGRAGLAGAGASAAGGSLFGGIGGTSASFAGSTLGSGFGAANETVRELETQIRQLKARLQDAERELQNVQRRLTLVEKAVRDLQRDIDAKRRIIVEEQQKLDRLQQLAAAVMGGPGSGVTGTLAAGLRGSVASGFRGSMASGLFPAGTIAAGLRGASVAGSLGGVGSRLGGFAGASMGRGLGSRAGGFGASGANKGPIPKPFTGDKN
ncbi:hypothetical protein TGMAS_289540 [Toxoplasma gondii MAS]|uniref:Uncharacterized protein n=2 Tax=Toxoplasma gondii TaxID=5811 RepID=A0A086Q499_TOXGO|nr:hypothetical protein TGMAS_289540 [Toxoplasma gondii MAS]PUA90168.1 hypothetical protein TGBR9_289540 [Toxoplasma gondii TgCATBr9]